MRQPRDPCLARWVPVARTKLQGPILERPRALKRLGHLWRCPTLAGVLGPVPRRGEATGKPRDPQRRGGGAAVTPCRRPRRDFAATVHGLRPEQHGRSAAGSGREVGAECSAQERLGGWSEIRRWRGFRWSSAIRRQGAGCDGHVSADTVRGRLEPCPGSTSPKNKVVELLAGGGDAIRFDSRFDVSRRCLCNRTNRVRVRETEDEESKRTSWFKNSDPFCWLRINRPRAGQERSKP